MLDRRGKYTSGRLAPLFVTTFTLGKILRKDNSIFDKKALLLC